MKHRTDFVTNSSSSSFVIRKNTGFTTKEEIFQFIKAQYLLFTAKQKELAEYCTNHEEFTKNTDRGYLAFRPIHSYNTPEGRRRNWDLLEDVERVIGISIFEYSETEAEWLKANTYEEYLALTKNEKYITGRKPFIILDMEESSADEVREVVEWYDECECELNSDCQNCPYSNTPKCKKTVFVAKHGKFCVWSESGFLPSLVAKQLVDISSLSCGHMG